MSDELIHPSSTIGQFRARLKDDVLIVTLPVAYLFLPGDPSVAPGFPTSEYQWTGNQDEDEEFLQKVRLGVYRTETIDTLAHEAGHMLGLGDEAVNDFPASVNGPLPTPDYTATVFRYTRELVRQHDDEGIMSRGSTIRFWHYTPFVETLKILTGSAAWNIV